MKKLLLLLLLIPNLVMAEKQREYTAEEIGLKEEDIFWFPSACNSYELKDDKYEKMKKSSLTDEEIYEQLKKICEKAEQKERKRELRIETKYEEHITISFKNVVDIFKSLSYKKLRVFELKVWLD